MQIVRKRVAEEAGHGFGQERDGRQRKHPALPLRHERGDAECGIEEEEGEDLLQDPEPRVAKQSIERRADDSGKRRVLREELAVPAEREDILPVPCWLSPLTRRSSCSKTRNSGASSEKVLHTLRATSALRAGGASCGSTRYPSRRKQKLLNSSTASAARRNLLAALRAECLTCPRTTFLPVKALPADQRGRPRPARPGGRARGGARSHDARRKAPGAARSRQAEQRATPPWEAPPCRTTGPGRSPAGARTTSRPLPGASRA